MKILLFGGNGCFGSEFVEVCKKKRLKLYHYSSKKLNIKNISKVKKIISTLNPNLIINSAAIVGINNCEKNYKNAFEINSIATLNLAKICEKRKITLIQISTHAIFDGTKKGTYIETDISKPNNVYSGTKYLSELFTKSICKKYYIIRFPSLYGKKNNVNGFFNKAIISLKKNKTLKVAYDKMDSPTYAKDAANQLVEIIKSKKPYGTYHVSNNGKTNYFEFISYLKKMINSKSKIIPVKDSYFKSKGFKILNASLKSNKLKHLRSWELAIQDYVKYNQLIEKS